MIVNTFQIIESILQTQMILPWNTAFSLGYDPVAFQQPWGTLLSSCIQSFIRKSQQQNMARHYFIIQIEEKKRKDFQLRFFSCFNLLHHGLYKCDLRRAAIGRDASSYLHMKDSWHLCRGQLNHFQFRCGCVSSGLRCVAVGESYVN